MQYDRFLDIHLVTSKPTDLSKYSNDPAKLAKKTAAQKLDGYDQGRYQYDFQSDRKTQKTFYIGKLQGKFAAAVAGAPPIYNPATGITRPQPNRAKGTIINNVLGDRPTPLLPNPNRFDKDHYISCYVDLETLQPGQPIASEFAELVAWVSAAATAGKIRLNCHGDSGADAGFTMGASSLSPADLVDALIRHGLKKGNPGDVRPHIAAPQNKPPADASWKQDSKVTRCENGQHVAFSFLLRKHHCRRCGGIFCDSCTRKRRTLSNPLTDSGHAAGIVMDCRVCDNCARLCDDDATITLVKARTGLTQITLALCLTARTATEFADMKTGFARNSIASRLVQALRQQHIHGIQVSGMNEVLAWDGKSFNAVFGVEYPGQSSDRKPGSGPMIDPFEGTGFAGSLSTNVSMTIPSSILGCRAEPGRLRIQPIFDAPEFIPVRDMKIMPCCGGNKLAFGLFTAEQERLVNQAFKKWTFVQWECIQQPVASIPELSRAAVNLSEPTGETGANAAFFTKARFGALNTPTTPAMAAASTRLGGDGPRFTKLLSAPQRRIYIEWARNDPKSIVVSGLEERQFKNYKVFELT
jgi:hypothetical protein